MIASDPSLNHTMWLKHLCPWKPRRQALVSECTNPIWSVVRPHQSYLNVLVDTLLTSLVVTFGFYSEILVFQSSSPMHCFPVQLREEEGGRKEGSWGVAMQKSIWKDQAAPLSGSCRNPLQMVSCKFQAIRCSIGVQVHGSREQW